MDTPMTKKELTHERIVAAAARALRRKGFAGVGVAEVMKEAGLTHGGFYAHFPSREAMLAEAVARAGLDAAASVSKGAPARSAEGPSAFRSLVERYLSEAHLTAVESGCPVAALVSELPRQAEELRAAGAQRVLAMVEAVHQALPASSTRDDALAATSTLLGALQMARALGTNARGRAVLAAARAALLQAHDPD